MKSFRLPVIICLSLLLSGLPLLAQVSISADNSDPDPSAMLDVQSTDKGVLIPRMDSAARLTIAAPADGLMVYDTTSESFWYYDEEWVEIRNTKDRITLTDLNPAGELFACVELLESIDVGNSISHSATDGEYFYFRETSGTDSLLVMDVSDPTNPTIIGGEVFDPTPTKFIVAEGYAYSISGNNSSYLLIYDLSVPATPVLAGNLVLGNTHVPNDIKVRNGYAYISDVQTDSIAVIDVSDPTNPTYAGGIDIPLNPQEIVLYGNYAYVWNAASRLYVLDVTDPLAISVLADQGAGGSFNTPILYGDYIICRGYQVLDLNNPLAPTIVTQGTLAGFATMTFDNTYAYATSTSTDELRIADISSPAEPSVVFGIDAGFNPGPPAKIGDVLVVPRQAGIVDIYNILPYCDSFVGVDPRTGQLIETEAEPNQQTLTLIGETLSISDGNSVDLSEVDNQTLAVAGEDLSISNGNSISLSALDNQTLSLSGSTLSIENGNSVDLEHLFPVGAIIMYYKQAPPAGWLVCNGSSFNAATYPSLAAHLGSNTLPDFRGRFPLATGNSGTGGAVNHNLGTTGGEETTLLLEEHLPPHSHGLTIEFREGSENGNGNDYSDLGAGNGQYNASEFYTSDPTGGGQRHNNMPPYLTVQFIIKAH